MNTARLAHACDTAGLQLVAWTSTSCRGCAPRSRSEWTGICANDPRLFDEL